MQYVFVPDAVKELYQERFRDSIWPKPENVKGISEVGSHGN